MKKGSGVGGDLANLLYRLQYACLVVGQHHADQTRFGADGAEDVRWVDEAAWLRGDEGGFDAVMCEAPGCFQNGRVLDGGGDEVIAAMQKAVEGRVVPFGAAGVEYHFGVMALEELGNGLAGSFDGGAGLLAVEMDRGCVAEMLHPIRTHGLDDLREQRRGGVGVHIDAHRGWECGWHRKRPCF